MAAQAKFWQTFCTRMMMRAPGFDRLFFCGTAAAEWLQATDIEFTALPASCNLASFVLAYNTCSI